MFNHRHTPSLKESFLRDLRDSRYNNPYINQTQRNLNNQTCYYKRSNQYQQIQKSANSLPKNMDKPIQIQYSASPYQQITSFKPQKSHEQLSYRSRKDSLEIKNIIPSYNQSNDISKKSIEVKLTTTPLNNNPLGSRKSSPNNQNKRVSISPIQLKQQSIDKNNRNELTNSIQIKYDPPKVSNTPNGVIKGYAANTNQGIVRNYNEDRVSIILNIGKPQHRIEEHWPKCSFFGVYDGHGGNVCADFLRDNLHHFVIREKSFPNDPIEAIQNGFRAAENYFQQLAIISNPIDKSGSCAIVVLFVDQNCYVANVGDSRAVLSSKKGKEITDLSTDHKPSEINEKQRIQTAGGQIYQTSMQTQEGDIIQGPLRVFPGQLSVSRTFGDIEAKIPQLGGNPKVVIAEPEIKHFKITSDQDFIILGCDGIYDQMQSKDAIEVIWQTLNKQKSLANLHQACAIGVDALLNHAIIKQSTDNVTVLMIALSEFTVKQQIENIYKIPKVHQEVINNENIFIDRNQIQIHKVPIDFRKNEFQKRHSHESIIRKSLSKEGKENRQDQNYQDIPKSIQQNKMNRLCN